MYFTLPIMFIALICPHISPLQNLLMTRMLGDVTLGMLLLWILSTPVQFHSGARFYASAYTSISHGAATMDVLVVMGSSAAYGYSIISMILGLKGNDTTPPVFFETSAMLLSIIMLGKYIEHLAKGRTSEALSSLMSLQAPNATLLTLDEEGKVVDEEVISIHLVQVGDILRVERGAKVPVDGVVTSGSTEIDEALVTGTPPPPPHTHTYPLN